MHISRINIFEMVIDGVKLLLKSNRKSCMGFVWHIYILPLPILKVKVMHFSAINIFEMVSDKVKITTVMKLIISYVWALFGIFTFDLGPF